MHRQREDGSGLGNLHDGLAEEACSPGSCASTRAVGCSLRGSAQSSSSRSKGVFNGKTEHASGTFTMVSPKKCAAQARVRPPVL